MMSGPLAGVKRRWEDPCASERAVMLRVSAGSARHKLSTSTERQNVERASLAAVGCSPSCRTEEGRMSCVSPIRSGSWGDPGHGLADVSLAARRQTNQCLQPASTCLTNENAPFPLERRVEVSVSRGDTGKHQRFFFVVPPPSSSWVSANAEGESPKITQSEYCNAVVRELLRQVAVETTLPVGDAWGIVCHGKNVRSHAGVESLVSALFSESCQRIPLAVFPLLKAG